jgi:hypothetical protein
MFRVSVIPVGQFRKNLPIFWIVRKIPARNRNFMIADSLLHRLAPKF